MMKHPKYPDNVNVNMALSAIRHTIEGSSCHEHRFANQVNAFDELMRSLSGYGFLYQVNAANVNWKDKRPYNFN